MLESQAYEDVIRLYDGTSAFAAVDLNGSIIHCTTEGADKMFGISATEALKSNIYNFLESHIDQDELRKLASNDPFIGEEAAEVVCLLRTKGKTFIWADRCVVQKQPPITISPMCMIPLRSTRSPILVQLLAPSHNPVERGIISHPVDATDLSFNDVFEDSYASYTLSASLSSASCLHSRSHSEQSLMSDAGVKIEARDDGPTDDDSSWGWFKTVSPSSSSNFTNMTAQITLM